MGNALSTIEDFWAAYWNWWEQFGWWGGVGVRMVTWVAAVLIYWTLSTPVWWLLRNSAKILWRTLDRIRHVALQAAHTTILALLWPFTTVTVFMQRQAQPDSRTARARSGRSARSGLRSARAQPRQC